jgi:hypothetical protein
MRWDADGGEDEARAKGRVKWPSSPAKLLLNFHRIDADSLRSSPANWFMFVFRADTPGEIVRISFTV